MKVTGEGEERGKMKVTGEGEEGERCGGKEHVDDGKKVELRVLVRGVAVEDPKLHHPDNMCVHERFDYYEVDLNRLKSGQVLVPCCDPLLSIIGAGGTLRIDSKIFTLGYLFREVDEIPDSVEHMEERVDCLKCVAFVDLNQDHPRKWKQAAPPIHYGLGNESAALGDRIYCLQSGGLDKPLVYVPDEDKWSVVDGAIPPTQYHDCSIADKIIPDPTHNRILLHLSHNGISPGIYAWYPDPDSRPDSSSEFPENATNSPTSPLPLSLECIRINLTSATWRKKTTLAQGMLFFFSRKFRGLIKVLDLVTNNWVRVKWSTPYPAVSDYAKARSMFYLGNGHLCLGLTGTCTTPCFGTRVYFYLFHFDRSNDSTITFSYRFKKFFDAHGLHYAEDFVPLGDICW